jgi:cation/acetate symporter
MAPQMFGAGTTWQVLVGKGFLGMDPYTTGVVIVAGIIAFYVAVGGMKGTTLNQIFQFWWLAFAMTMVVVFSFGNGFSYPDALKTASERPIVNTKAMTVAELTKADPTTGKTPYDAAAAIMTAEEIKKVDEFIAADSEGKVPVALPSKNKLHELRDQFFTEPGHRYNAFDQFSMVLALVLGTAGLPHILNRYYTNPSGSAARRSTFWVLIFIGMFYIFAPIAGLAGIGFIKDYLAGGGTLAAPTVHGMLVKPDQVMPTLAEILGGQWLMGIVSAGAFAAMFSTVGGLLIAAASAIGHDVYEKYVNPNATEAKRVVVGKIAVLSFAALALLIGLAIPKYGLDQAYPALIAMMVTWAFSVGASAFVPMLLTGIWWKGTTEKGATAGMVVGLTSAIAIIFLNIFQQLGTVGKEGILGFFGALTFPVLFTFPLGLLTIIIVSKIDGQLPKNVDQIWMRIHGTASERHEKQHGLDKVGSMFAKHE